MAALTPNRLRWIAYALLTSSLIPIALTIHQFIKSRRAPYYVMRRKARRRAGRWALLALGLETFVIALLVAPMAVPLLIPAAPPTSTLTPPVSPTRPPAPQPTCTPRVTPTRGATATAPLIPTSTPDTRLPEWALSPVPSAVPAGADARIELKNLATEKDENDRPVNSGSEFPPGDHRVYLFFGYEGMQDGIATTFAWYKEEELIDFCSDRWLWGLAEGRDWGERGSTMYYCKPPSGWDPGTYEIHVFIEDRLQGVAQFTIAEE